jgi:uncharacterized membrane protein
MRLDDDFLQNCSAGDLRELIADLREKINGARRSILAFSLLAVVPAAGAVLALAAGADRIAVASLAGAAGIMALLTWREHRRMRNQLVRLETMLRESESRVRPTRETVGH